MCCLSVRTLTAVLLCGAVTLTASAQDRGSTPQPSPAAVKISKIREALDQKVTLDFTSQNFADGIEHLRQKTKVNIILDRMAMQIMGIGFDDGQPTPIHLKIDNGPARVALRGMLNSYGMTYIVMPDGVLVTTEQMAHVRQMRQRVSVDVSGKGLAAALKNLAAETGTTVIIDPRVAKDAQVTIDLKLDDVTLETAVRLLTEVGGLKSVPVGNVLFVTDEKKAAQIRKENNENLRNPNFPDVPFGAIPPVRIAPDGVIRGGGGQAVPGNPGRAIQPPAPPAKEVPPMP